LAGFEVTIEARRADYSLYAGSPELPLHARWPVRVLAGSVYCIRALFVELGNDKPMKEIMEEHGDLYSKVREGRCCKHLCIPENDEFRAT
jgi:hypothetical protein